MGSIHIMSPELVGRIAAGEVDERPASVVKELVENSIDAGATMIRINVEQGGKKLIQVIDNGCGMDRTDALLCLETHATSKLTESGDVGQISTLGFRGEALPSIASVSHFTLQTRRANDTAGTEIAVDYGRILDARDCGCAPGTNIRVSRLFANLPARQKFMRGPETEDGYIEEIVRMLALSRPDIGFALFTNNRETLRVNPSPDMGTRVAAVMGREIFSSMLPVNYSEDGVTVRGYITNPGYTRSSRREQRAIVNGRAASADTIYFAIRDSFESLVMKGRYPGAVIYIDLPPDKVDVNVHPTKREVRFRDQRIIGQIVAAAIRRALRGMAGGGEMNPVDQERKDAQKIPETPISAVPMPSTVPSPPPRFEPSPAPAVQLSLSMSPALPESVPHNCPVPEQQPEAANTIVQQSGSRASLKRMRFLDMLGSSYALAESENGLVIINLKAAHQRIVFERLLAGLKDQSVPRQQLLLPETIELGVEDAKFMRTHSRHFDQLGFGIEPFGGNSFLLTAVPAAMPGSSMGRVIRDIIDDLRQSPATNRQNTMHLAQVACRHAIFSTDNIRKEDAMNILRDLTATDMPYACPNGHPTMIHLTYTELSRRFSN